MYIMHDLIKMLRDSIGDTDLNDPNITDDEMEIIIKKSASEYSRIKNHLKIIKIPYDKEEEIYDLPEDCYKVKEVSIKNKKIQFIDNMSQIILEQLPQIDGVDIKITYSRYFQPTEIDERELDIFLLYAEALCYKLMASKTADLIKFSTGEKIIDESLISEKYLELFNSTVKQFRKRAIKAYGRRASNIKDNLDYDLPYPPIGETP